jgi:hypothetical protein
MCDSVLEPPACDLVACEHAENPTKTIVFRGEHAKARCQRLPVQLSCTRGAATCNIFYIPTSEVEVPELPLAWVLDGIEYDTLTLGCGHVFNPSALTLHFLVSDMRCPACRTGPAVRLDAACLPNIALRQIFGDKAAAIAYRTEETTEISLTDLIDASELDLNRVEQDLTFTIEISLFGAGALRSNMLQTRISPIHHHRSGEFVHYVTQQSFQRLFSRQVARHRQNKSARVRFHVQHPLLAQSMSSPSYALPELIASMTTRQFVLPFVFGDELAEQTPVLATLVFTPPKQNTEVAQERNLDIMQSTTTESGASDRSASEFDNIQTNPEQTSNSTIPDSTPDMTTPATQPHTTVHASHRAAANAWAMEGHASDFAPEPAHATLLVHRQGVLAICVAAAQHALLNSMLMLQGN